MAIVAPALVAMGVALPHAVEDTHHPPTTPATHQSREQGAPTARRFARTVLLHVGVLEQELLVLLIVLPADITRMAVAQQNVPFVSGLVEPADLAGAPIDHPRSLGSPTEGVSSSVERIVQDLHDAVIGRRLPDQLADLD